MIENDVNICVYYTLMTVADDLQSGGKIVY